MKIGIDIEKIERFNLNRGDSFIENNFTKDEINYAFSKKMPEATLCGLFCAKEAIIKTLDKQDILLNEIEISWNSEGKPSVKFLKGRYLEDSKFSISISHSGEYATAIALRGENDK